ncbi:hypothetical protein JOB18_046794 [Solea senegalensis]|uniref:Uncharacterized protein n=1 Tax=Solea senegalensis TaxID=28829 RepID=A0AAV6RXR7_SOLSE|nr:hypothetical protein JOB18_046794 [Solea senegalensis]
MQSTLIKVTSWSRPWKVLRTSDKVWQPEEDVKNGQHTSDLTCERRIAYSPPCTFLWDLYFLPNTSVYKQTLNKEFLNHRRQRSDCDC